MNPLVNRSVEGDFSVSIRIIGVYRLHAPDLYPGGAGRYIADLVDQAVDQKCQKKHWRCSTVSLSKARRIPM